jgi:hypothetical protein
MKNQKNLIVQLRVYKGQVNFDENGNLTSESQLMKLRYGIREWTLFLKSIYQMGWTRVDVVKCFDGNEKLEENGMFNHPETDIPSNIEAEIKVAMEGDKKKLTPEQQEIKELKAQMAEIVKGKQKKEAPKEKSGKGNDDEALNLAREKYEELFKKKPHHKKTLEKINNEIDAKLNSGE